MLDKLQNFCFAAQAWGFVLCLLRFIFLIIVHISKKGVREVSKMENSASERQASICTNLAFCMLEIRPCSLSLCQGVCMQAAELKLKCTVVQL